MQPRGLYACVRVVRGLLDLDDVAVADERQLAARAGAVGRAGGAHHAVDRERELRVVAARGGERAERAGRGGAACYHTGADEELPPGGLHASGPPRPRAPMRLARCLYALAARCRGPGAGRVQRRVRARSRRGRSGRRSSRATAGAGPGAAAAAAALEAPRPPAAASAPSAPSAGRRPRILRLVMAIGSSVPESRTTRSRRTRRETPRAPSAITNTKLLSNIIPAGRDPGTALRRRSAAAGGRTARGSLRLPPGQALQ